MQSYNEWFDFSGKTALVTGGCGILGKTVCKALASCGARIAILDLDRERAETTAREIAGYYDQTAGYEVNILDKDQLENACTDITRRWDHIDMLLNFAGGNQKNATVSEQVPFFDLNPEDIDANLRLNISGTMLPCQVAGRIMARSGSGSILNVSSMSAMRPLSKVVSYSAAKAAISNFTQWLAVYMATEFNSTIRVNAIAPGFFIGEQNRDLLIDPQTKEMTPRARTILDHTPMNRFGVPDDIVGTVLWLLSPAAAFVTGIVVPIDGGFSACSGV